MGSGAWHLNLNFVTFWLIFVGFELILWCDVWMQGEFMSPSGMVRRSYECDGMLSDVRDSRALVPVVTTTPHPPLSDSAVHASHDTSPSLVCLSHTEHDVFDIFTCNLHFLSTICLSVGSSRSSILLSWHQACRLTTPCLERIPWIGNRKTMARASHSQNNHIFPYFTTIWRLWRPKYNKSVNKGQKHIAACTSCMLRSLAQRLRASLL